MGSTIGFVVHFEIIRVENSGYWWNHADNFRNLQIPLHNPLEEPFISNPITALVFGAEASGEFGDVGGGEVLGGEGGLCWCWSTGCWKFLGFRSTSKVGPIHCYIQKEN